MVHTRSKEFEKSTVPQEKKEKKKREKKNSRGVSPLPSVRAIERTIRFSLNNNDNNNNNETMKIQWQRYNVEKNSEYLTR